ncbi:hypothetical protein ACQEVI_05830 [Promicromonospora sp. CA-289599]|uniref:hypothetical protein n=1 Tax=Promicromonospora sp. CA-289599 TaxID=3240014 RepID=UPI003D8C0753
MDPSEMREFLRELEEVLRSAGLNSIVDHERLAATEGRTTDAVIPKQARSGDVRVVELTVQDRIGVLLDLLEAAVGGTFAIEGTLIGFAARNDVQEQIAFSPDRHEFSNVEDAQPWETGGRAALEERRADVRAVLQTIEAIRSATGHQRSATLEPIRDQENDWGGWA